jgi:hypothetical protein
MALETRRGRRYYYRYRRAGKKAAKIYVGCGAVAEMAARRDAEARANREKTKQEVSRLAATLQHADALLDELNRSIDLLVAAKMLAAGFHPHGRSWRRHRG